ncbi:hypothetical protein LguiA_018657 [Lonicera macranthoides]
MKQNMAKKLSIATAIFVVATLVQTMVAQEIHVVGDNMGWIVPPLGSIAYRTWAATNTFIIGDILVFNFTSGQQDVARVTKEAFDTCNSTNPIAIETTSPANFTLSSLGEYYFISTLDRHCPLGQKLAINVTTPPPPPPARPPVTYNVGDQMGWIVPPGGSIAYSAWAYNKTFIVGDTLVFNFINGTQDVAIVSKLSYETCDTNTTTTVLTTSPARFTLTTTGGHYFTSTYPRRCSLGQRLAINVTAPLPSSSGSAMPPSSYSSSYGPSAGGPSPPPLSSATPRTVTAIFATFMSIGIALFV